ncbi:hypothetical protein CYMTET_20709 [Cymbomonas tetramitiformis]|uniref:Uncharacterized protein n=1 Tax=Cymbomonas tetramitiformis TaxID=36881 RepID=A0AAE0L3L7_9CHLO|nr:hypothetical protein CYMTET_20709 [Cymbomonas tetramitiformis]
MTTIPPPAVPVEELLKLEMPQPISASTVWEEMDSWQPQTPMPNPMTPTKADIGTSVQRRLASTTAACQEALDLAGDPPAYQLSDVRIKGWNAGALDFDMYMLDTSMEMTDTTFTKAGMTNSEPLIALRSDDMIAVNANQQTAAKADEINNVYMFNNKLTMTDTVFNFNVGGAGTQLADSITLGDSLDINTLNINLYMCHNTMGMSDTDFTLNVSPSSQPASTGKSAEENVKTGCDKNMDLLQTVWISLLSLSDSQAQLGMEAGVDVFDWMKSVCSGDTCDINMHMYNNDMSMATTIFTMNVGSDAAHVVGADKTAQPASSDLNTAPASLQPSANVTRRRLSSSDLEMRDQTMSMVGTSLTMNVGAAGTQLVVSSSSGAAQSMSMGNLNVKMQMYSNQMSMSTTDFSSNMNE